MMNRQTAVGKLARMAPTDAEIRRVLHTLPSNELRQYLANQNLALDACRHPNPDIEAAARQAIQRTVKVAQAILDSRVCVAS